MKLRANKRTRLNPVRANIGVETAYYDAMARKLDKMHASVLYWVSAQYKKNPPLALRVLAQDGSPASDMRKTMSKLGTRWQRSFAAGADDMAAHFANESMTTGDKTFQAILKKAGFSVAFKNTRAQNDAYRAVVGENVGLIKSLAKDFMHQVEQEVLRSVQRGRDLATLRDKILERAAVSKNRANFIARDQNNKATSLIVAVRQRGLGIKKAEWMHSGGGIHPRESHEEADGTEYEVDQGCLIDGEYIFPGEEPNCRCVAGSIIPGWDDDD